MRTLFPFLALSLILPLNMVAQFCIDKIVITYEPFEIKNRDPVSVKEFDRLTPTDTIVDSVAISAILNQFQKIQKGKKEQCYEFSPKVLCRFYSNQEELFRFYYTTFKRVYYNGHYYEEYLELLNFILLNISSDDRFFEKYKSKN